MPKRRAASRWLSPSTWQAWRTRPSSSTENIPAFPGSFRTRSKKALSRYSLVPPRPDYPAAVSVAHFVSAALTCCTDGLHAITLEELRQWFDAGGEASIPHELH